EVLSSVRRYDFVRNAGRGLNPAAVHVEAEVTRACLDHISLGDRELEWDQPHTAKILGWRDEARARTTGRRALDQRDEILDPFAGAAIAREIGPPIEVRRPLAAIERRQERRDATHATPPTGFAADPQVATSGSAVPSSASVARASASFA